MPNTTGKLDFKEYKISQSDLLPAAVLNYVKSFNEIISSTVIAKEKR